MTRQRVNTYQGVVAFVAITLGVIPLLQYLLRGIPGSIWRGIFGHGPHAAGWAAPLVVVIAAVIAITLLECAARR